MSATDAAIGADQCQQRSAEGVSIIATPLAGEKLTKKSLKLVKKSAGQKQFRRGIKECVKALRKGEKGIMIIAGNITPIDVISHMAILCEENDIPYIYVPTKEDLGTAGGSKRPTSCILAKSHEEYDELYKEVEEKVKAAHSN
jgi:H/ACA ribonucleoprotein complex subunit 2